MGILTSRRALVALLCALTAVTVIPPALGHGVTGNVWGEIRFTDESIGACSINGGPIKECFRIRIYPKVNAGGTFVPGIYEARAWITGHPSIDNTCFFSSPQTGCAGTVAEFKQETHYRDDVISYYATAELYDWARGRVDGPHTQGAYTEIANGASENPP